MWSKADFRAIPEIAENPQMPVCQWVPAFWLLACRMDADTLPNHALHHLNYTWNCETIITDTERNCKGKRFAEKNLRQVQI